MPSSVTTQDTSGGHSRSPTARTMSTATSTTAVESPSAYPESPLDGDDVVYSCKGCEEILEEGKAFELAGNRWHIDCFRCNSCDTLLDSDANLLLLGDGSLICNNCTYSCSACGNKIEDLAILTGDQAFCSSCFRCRNCKRKIDNLRYARTSQGIFCMSCHESLMARRRKKARATPKPPSSNGPGVEKALPSLPPDAAKGSSVGTPSETTSQSPQAPSVGTPPETATESRTTQEQRSPRERHTRSRNESINAYTSFIRDTSPTSEDARKAGLSDSSQRQQPKATPETNLDGPTLPASTYSDGKSRPSNVVSVDDESEGYLPMAFDPTPIAAPPVSRKPAPRQAEPSPPVQVQSENRAPRDYFGNSGRLSARAPGTRDVAREDQRSASSRSASTEREREIDRPTPKASPHILSQDKGRLGSGRKRDPPTSAVSANGSAVTSPIAANSQEKSQRQTPQQSISVAHSPQQQQEDQFKLQHAPQHKRAPSKSISDPLTLVAPTERAGATDPSVNGPPSPVSVSSRNSGINPFDDPKRREHTPASPPTQSKNQLPLRADSLSAVAHRKQPSQDISSTPVPHKRHPSTSSVPTTLVDAKSTISRDNSRTKPTDPGVTRSSTDALPPRSSSRPDASSKLSPNDDFSTPRASPAPPIHGHRQHESISTLHSEDRRSVELQPSPDPRTAGLPKYTSEGNFSMEDEMGRILRGEKREGADGGSSVLRRVSNAVKHNRNFSERESSRPAKSPVNGVVEISSPIPIGTPSVTSPTPTNVSQDSIDQVRASLRRAQVQIAELETDKLSLQEQLNGSSEIMAVNTELHEKRSTMVILDSQREVIVRELEIMTEHLTKAKDGREPFDLGSLKASVLKDFAESLLRLKETMGQQIEDLMRKRNELTDEITALIQMKDKGFQEYESLSNRNTQLLQHNNDLLRNIQGVYQENRGSNGSGASNANGLGIFNGANKGEGTATSEMRDFRPVAADVSLPTVVQESSDADHGTVHGAPQVINIRKPTKFNWRKGGESLAKNVTKGLKGAFAADRLPPSRDGGIGVPYNATHQVISGSELSSNASTRVATEDGRSGSSAGFGFFNQKNGAALRPGGLKDGGASVASTDGSVLFGSELQARCDFENRVIPSIVSRCIQEVEARGMDVEGIYRKSGGAGQVKSVQQGFERDHDHAISDPDLEIHAVTSALKQYFRKLPTPLIVYDVYDHLLEAGQMTANRDKQVVALKLAVHDLPDAHRDCLQFLIQHLARVMSHDSRNLMTALNLAAVFAPTIMRPLSIEREMTDMQTQRAAVQALLENHRSVFPE